MSTGSGGGEEVFILSFFIIWWYVYIRSTFEILDPSHTINNKPNYLEHRIEQH